MNRYGFILGLILAPFAYLFFYFAWDKNPAISQSQAVAAKKEVSLLSINYIPTQAPKPIEDASFLEVSVSGSDKKTRTLAEFKGKPVILHFWAPYCGPCVQEMPELDAFAAEYGNDVHIIAISTDPQEGEALKQFYASKGIKNLSIAVDQKGSIGRRLGISALPTTLFIKPSGEIMGQIIGPVDWVGEPGKLLTTHLAKQ